MLNQLRPQRAQAVDRMRDILATAEREGRELTAEERTNWDAADAEQERLKGDIARAERTEGEARSLDGSRGPTVRPDVGGTNARVDVASTEYGEAYRSWMVNGMSAVEPEQRQLLQRAAQQLPAEARALAAGTGSAGGYTVPEGFYKKLTENMLAYGGMLEPGTHTPILTQDGAPLPMPGVDDTSNVGAILAENNAASEADATFSVTQLDAYMYTSKLVRVPFQLLQDSAFDIESWLARALATRLARIYNTHFTTGTGTSQPRGVVTAASLGTTGASGQVTSIIYDDFVNLEHSIDPSYRKGGRWMMHDSMLKVIKKLKDSDGRPLWQAGLAGGSPDSILNHPYSINQDMAVPAASAKSLLFGDFSAYYERFVRDIVLLRLSERYAEYLQVGFIAFQRADGDLLDVGTDPIKYYAHPAS
jgi:HK97 family phage major capsid protein